MPDLNYRERRWRDQQLRPLPKYIIGELETMTRRARLIEQQIAKLEALQDQEIDTSEYDTNIPDKYFTKWFDKYIAEGAFVKNPTSKRYYAVAFQSCWPEESDGMIFQWFKALLDVRFKWFTSFRENDDKRGLSLKEEIPKIVNYALPNVNGNYYQCGGDYSERFYEPGRMHRLIEVLNYASSPNLRENNEITSIYSRLATAFQYVPLEIKRGAETELTTIGELWLELIDKANSENGNDPGFDLAAIKRKHCAWCGYNDKYVDRKINQPNGSKGLEIYSRLIKMLDGNFEKIDQLYSLFDVDTITKMVQSTRECSACEMCIFNYIDKDEAEKLYDHIKQEYDKRYGEVLGPEVPRTTQEPDHDPNVPF